MTSTEQHSRQRTFADYLAILRRRKWFAIIPIILVPVAAYAYSSQQPAVYGASAEVLLSRQDLGSSLSGATNADVYTDADRFATTQAALARVPIVVRRAAATASIPGVGAADLHNNSSVSPRGNADILEFTVRNPDSKVAATLAAAYAKAFTDYRLELDTAALTNARKELQRTITSLERSGETDSTLYRSLTQKVQELRTLELLQQRAEVVKTVDSGGQVAPTPRRNAMLALAVGILLGLGAVLLAEALDRRVRDEDEIQRMLALPLLARLPVPRSDRLAMLDDPSDVDAEAVRRLRTNIEFANLDLHAKAIMVTSSVGVEGKTTTVSNVAVAMARAGHRVALVDLDLRKPMVGKMFGIEFRPGLADVAIERIELDRALVPIRLRATESIRLGRSRRSASSDETGGGPPEHDAPGQLFVLPAGFLPANPGELVGTHAVQNILKRLRDEMDYVFVDAPPMLTVSDAAVLSTRVDAMFVVVRLGLVNRPMLRDLARELDASPAPKLGFILTGAGAAELYGAGTYAYLARGDRPEELDESAAPTARRGAVGAVADTPAVHPPRAS